MASTSQEYNLEAAMTDPNVSNLAAVSISCHQFSDYVGHVCQAAACEMNARTTEARRKETQAAAMGSPRQAPIGSEITQEAQDAIYVIGKVASEVSPRQKQCALDEKEHRGHAGNMTSLEDTPVCRTPSIFSTLSDLQLEMAWLSPTSRFLVGLWLRACLEDLLRIAGQVGKEGRNRW